MWKIYLEQLIVIKVKFQCTGVILDNNCYILKISCTCCISLSHELDNQIRGIIATNVCLLATGIFYS